MANYPLFMGAVGTDEGNSGPKKPPAVAGGLRDRDARGFARLDGPEPDRVVLPDDVDAVVSLLGRAAPYTLHV